MAFIKDDDIIVTQLVKSDFIPQQLKLIKVKKSELMTIKRIQVEN